MPANWDNLFGTTGAITTHTQRGSEGVENYWTNSAGERFDIAPWQEGGSVPQGYTPLTAFATTPELVQAQIRAGTYTEDAMTPNDTWGTLLRNDMIKDIDAGFSLKDLAMVFGPLALTVGPYMLAGVAMGGGAGAGAAGLSESAIAEIIAAEGGFSALPSTGMAGTAISGASGGGFWDAIMQATTGAVNSGGSFGMEELMKMVMGKNPWGNIFNIGRGIYGLHQSRDMQKLAEQAMKTENPFGPYRDEYAQKLRGLYADPSSITKMPGYEAGIQAVNRGMAKSGYLGSGNQMTALQKFGGDFFNAEADRLAMLAGAKFAPGGGSQLLQGSIAAKQLEGNALNTLIYGVLGAGASGVLGRGGGNPIPGGTPPIFAPTEAYNYDFDGADLGNLLALIG